MHEISIAESIIEIAETAAREANSCSIRVIAVRLGEFTSIVREALEFAFEAAKQGTLAEDARLEIEVVPMVVQCVVCDAVVRPMTRISLICGQ
jgi:hydrogenase nickel incorporation protein HypA/HybF